MDEMVRKLFAARSIAAVDDRGRFNVTLRNCVALYGT